MTTTSKMCQIEEICNLLGEATCRRLSGLSQEDLHHIVVDKKCLHPLIAARIRDGVRAAAIAANIPLADDAIDVVRKIFEARPHASHLQILIGLELWRSGTSRALRDICEDFSGDPNASGPNDAVHKLVKAGLVKIEGKRRQMQVRWIAY